MIEKLADMGMERQRKENTLLGGFKGSVIQLNYSH